MDNRITIVPNQLIVLLYNAKEGKWESKANQISAMYEVYNRRFINGYNIYFRNGSQKYFYSLDNVKLYKFLGIVNIENYDVLINEKVVDAVEVRSFENNYYVVKTKTKVIESSYVTFRSNQYRKTLDYFLQLADYASKISTEEEPLFYLALSIMNLQLDQDSVLFDYLNGKSTHHEYFDPIIIPFDFNKSQHLAINQALTHSISVIEGPPGTGKTQTILNLVSNIVSRGQNCAVISNNNTAVDNIFEKLKSEHFSFIVASLGRQENVENFFNEMNDNELIEFLNSPLPQMDSSIGLKIQQLTAQMNIIYEMEIELAKLRNELYSIEVEQRNHQSRRNDAIAINHKLEWRHYLHLIHRLEKGKKIRLIGRLLIKWKFHVNLHDVNHNLLIHQLESLFYIKRITVLKTEISRIENDLSNYNKAETLGKLKQLSRDRLSSTLNHHYQSIGLKRFSASTYRAKYSEFIQRYPVVLSTSHSLVKNAPRDFLFDFLIIDEASQGDLLSSVLAMSCAKKVVVVGDSRQLQQIDEVRLFDQSKRLAGLFHVPPSYQYAEHSVLSSIRSSIVDLPVTLLREHYRCAPDIINFCNQMFYDGELIPMTNNNGIHIEVIKTVPGNHARRNPRGSGFYNQREIDEIRNYLDCKELAQIGVITPFRYQAECIGQQVSQPELEADTIHKFQGCQKNEVILSFVVNNLDQDEQQVDNRLYDFVTNEKLLNVAISRGQSKVVMIVSDKVYHSKNNVIHDFIHYAETLYGNAITKSSSITSVFDILYKERYDFLKPIYQNHPKDYHTELLMMGLLDDVLKSYPKLSYTMHVRLSTLINDVTALTEDELKYVMNTWTHVDFLIYHKVSKERLVVIEVDGIHYHEQNRKQTKHDSIKDKALVLNNIPIHRFKTNQSDETGRICHILSQFTS